MASSIGLEFKTCAAPTEELMRRLYYLAEQDSGSVLTDGFRHGQNVPGDSDKDGSKRDVSSALEFLTAQEELKRDQMRRLSERLDILESASRRALIEAENDLAEALSNANRAIDGRAVFGDEDGNIRDEDGQIIDPSRVDMDKWDPKGTTWNKYDTRESAVERTSEIYDRVRAAQTRLEADDLSEDDLESLLDEVNSLEATVVERHNNTPNDIHSDFDQQPNMKQDVSPPISPTSKPLNPF